METDTLFVTVMGALSLFIVSSLLIDEWLRRRRTANQQNWDDRKAPHRIGPFVIRSKKDKWLH